MNKTGFGFLRLPEIEKDGAKEIDYPLVDRMVDDYMSRGGRYFDTAYTYLDGRSEAAVKRCLVERHDRGSFILADKLPGWKVKKPEDNRMYFNEQLERCGVSWFDVYLIHWLNAANFEVAERMDQFGFLSQLKKEGLAKKVGFSYHDGPELLERILSAHPDIDIVQLQINYLDWESPAIRARECYEVAARHGKQVVIMEPVKGGTLASLPPAAEELLKNACPERSIPAWAIRFASRPENVAVVLSGMNTPEQISDNMADFEPLTDHELGLLAKAADIIRGATAIPCTGCNYCAPNCPMSIPIPRLFALYNEYKRYPEEGWKMPSAYREACSGRGLASSCIECRMCESNCPQQLPITDHLKTIREQFEK